MFSDERFPDDISYGSSGGPVFSTSIVSNAAGYEKRNSQWAQARSVYNVAHGIKSKIQLDMLIAFFRARQGRFQAFRFKDWTDYAAFGQSLGVGDGTTTIFQLVKIYNSGASAYMRPITRPVTGSVQLFLNGVLQDSGVTIDHDSGRITFDIAPEADVIVSADFEFDVPVRFETDQLIASLDDAGVYSWGDIALVEIRE